MPDLHDMFSPAFPQTVTVSGTHAEFSATNRIYFSLHSTIDAFYSFSGNAEADGSTCHFIGAGATIPFYAPVGTVVSIISADTSSGPAYITEWV